jgi:hypothetical protein
MNDVTSSLFTVTPIDRIRHQSIFMDYFYYRSISSVYVSSPIGGTFP